MKQLRSVLVALALCGCTGSGTLSFVTAPAAFTGEFADGWSFTAEQVLLSFGELQISDADGMAVATLQQPKVVDLIKSSPVELTRFEQVPALRYPDLRYSLKSMLASVPANATVDDLELMHMYSYSVFIKGRAQKGNDSKRIAWGFALDTIYERCHEAGAAPGIAVAANQDSTVELTVRPEQLWRDGLDTTDAPLRWQAMADADRAPADGEVTLAELDSVQLANLTAGHYAASASADIKTLKQFVTAQVRALGGYRGAGACVARAR